MSKRWPSGVPVVYDRMHDLEGAITDWDDDLGYFRVTHFQCGDGACSMFRSPRELKPLNPDAVAILEIAKEGCK